MLLQCSIVLDYNSSSDYPICAKILLNGCFFVAKEKRCSSTNSDLDASIGTSLAVQWLRLCTSTAGGSGSIPGWGTRIPHAVWRVQNK